MEIRVGGTTRGGEGGVFELGNTAALQREGSSSFGTPG